MQSHARVVIVGGGVMGISLAYGLALEGWTDTILIEKGDLTSGSTWHAAGQCPSFIADYSLAKVHAYSNELYAKLEGMTGEATGWHASGGIRFATNQLELDHFKRVEGVASLMGFRMQVVGPDEIRRINPFVTTEGVLAGAWTLDDGYVDPSSACNAMAKLTRGLGATIVRKNRVLGIELLPTGEFLVRTEQGDVTAEHVVNAAGCYADKVSAWLGVNTQYANMKHQYVVTGPVKEFLERDGEIPVMRDPWASSYYRQEQKSGLIGIYEDHDTEEAWGGATPPWESDHELFEPQLDRILPNLEKVMERMPIFAEAGIKRVVNGAISHTPDSNPLVGPAPGVRNYWLATATGIGIAQGPGCGKFLAQQMVHGDAEINMLGMDPRRYGDFCDKGYAQAKAHREYWDMYRLVPPGEERPEGRPAKKSSLYERLAGKGAVFGEGYGWERPKWFPPAGVANEEDPTFRRTNAFPVVAAECHAVRERVGVMELPSFATYGVHGADAEAMLNRVYANRMPKVGGITLAHALSDNGRFITETTITRLAPDRFFLLSGAYAHQQDLDLLHRAVLPGEDVTITDRTRDFTTLIVAGPRARDVLAGLADVDLSTPSFPWLTGREATVAGVAVKMLRVNYVGELGWELHVPMDGAVAVYDAIWAAGEPFGIADFGLYAMNSLRMEKAYKGWGAELTAEITPAEADTMRFVKLDHEFRGRAALEAVLAEGAKIHLRCLEVAATDFDARGGEPVFADGAVVGVTTSGGYGHVTGKSLAFAYINSGHEAAGTALEVALLGERRAATVLAEPVWDPANTRLRA